jgi:hypothetical protein
LRWEKASKLVTDSPLLIDFELIIREEQATRVALFFGCSTIAGVSISSHLLSLQTHWVSWLILLLCEGFRWCPRLWYHANGRIAAYAWMAMDFHSWRSSNSFVGCRCLLCTSRLPWKRNM